MIEFDYVAKTHVSFTCCSGMMRTTIRTLLEGDVYHFKEPSGTTFKIDAATKDEIKSEMIMRQYRAEHHGPDEMKRV